MNSFLLVFTSFITSTRGKNITKMAFPFPFILSRSSGHIKHSSLVLTLEAFHFLIICLEGKRLQNGPLSFHFLHNHINITSEWAVFFQHFLENHNKAGCNLKISNEWITKGPIANNRHISLIVQSITALKLCSCYWF